MPLKTIKPRVQAMSAARVSSPSGTKRITGNSLYAIMRRFEREHPRVCAQCEREGRVAFGDQLDHIVPLHLGGAESDANRQWLCHRCHSDKSAQEAQARATGEGPGAGRKV